MKVTEEGTTNIIRWYQPESAEECKSTDCMKCVYYSYIPSSSSCPFEAWMINHPVEKATGTDKSNNALQDQRSAQDIFNMCTQLQANTIQMQVESLQDMVNVLDLIIEVTEKQDKLTKIQQKQPVQDDQSNVPTWFLPSMENAVDEKYGRDYYHHCPDKNNKLVRLDLNVCGSFHYCPACLQSFVMK